MAQKSQEYFSGMTLQPQDYTKVTPSQKKSWEWPLMTVLGVLSGFQDCSLGAVLK